jgi:hypothetical protein
MASWIAYSCRMCDSFHLKSLINVKQWVRNLSKSGTLAHFLTKFSKFARTIGTYAYLSKKPGAWILKAPKHSWEKNWNLQTGSAHTAIFADFWLKIWAACASCKFLLGISCVQSHFLGSYNDQDYPRVAKISKQYLFHTKLENKLFWWSWRNGHY